MRIKTICPLISDTLSIIPFELWVPAHLPLSCKRDWAEALVFRQRKRLLILFLISQTSTLILKMHHKVCHNRSKILQLTENALKWCTNSWESEITIAKNPYWNCKWILINNELNTEPKVIFLTVWRISMSTYMIMLMWHITARCPIIMTFDIVATMDYQTFININFNCTYQS